MSEAQTADEATADILALALDAADRSELRSVSR
jgi:hypothetical protein